uniref:PR domain zinc finger protein 2-like n=1 Tax=Dromaius novaehollandiae TaxID=8790 RepID=A0A8C4KRZ3_DRONO
INQIFTTEPIGTVETLADVPEHVLRGLPEDVKLFPSAVDKTRLGVWATKSILKGKKFGPFVGDKKKRSQVKSNVYMWEVYYPNLGWMCVDATDPKKGNWLRYINWARSGKEQNLFPLEINRTIYYKSLKVAMSMKNQLLVFQHLLFPFFQIFFLPFLFFFLLEQPIRTSFIGFKMCLGLVAVW